MVKHLPNSRVYNLLSFRNIKPNLGKDMGMKSRKYIFAESIIWFVKPENSSTYVNAFLLMYSLRESLPPY